jgi:predicted phage-related endonuclease
MTIKCKNDCPESKFDGCCCVCPYRDNGECEPCDKTEPQDCPDAVFEGTGLEVFQNKAAAIIKKISLIVSQKAEIEKAEKEMREELQKAMDKHGVKKFDNDVIKVTYVEASTRTSIDSTKLKAQQPDIYEKFSKTNPVKAFVKIELKGDKD